MTDQASVNFTVHNIYLKDVSFECPNSPQVFTLEWNPKLEFDIQMGHTSLEKDLYEVTMAITVRVDIAPAKDAAANSENKTAFLVEVKQAGIFLIQGIEDQNQIEYILATTAPTILFPYAREAVSSLVTKGGFPQLVIPPINFDAMYQQHLAENQKTASTQEQAHA